MRPLTGKVVDGKIEVEHDLEEGARVAVLALDPEVPHLSVEDERELAAALEEIRAGDFIDGRELVAELKARAQP